MTPATRFDWHTVIDAKSDAPEDVVRALDEYFKPFAQPVIDVDATGNKSLGVTPCLKCDEPLTGGLVSWMMDKGGFEWGIAHGEGRCSNCGWPARGHHYIKDASGKNLATLRNFVLQYHPDEVTVKEDRGLTTKPEGETDGFQHA